MIDLSNWTARPAPQPVRLAGQYVTVEPYERERHLEDLWAGLGGMGINPLLRYFAQPDFSGIEDFDAWLSSVAKAGWVTHVFRERASGKLAGMANYMRADPANGVVEIGGIAHGSAMARSPLSTEAQYLMARHVFDDLGYRRYEWKCDNRNEASKTTAQRLGFTFEGVFRQHMLSKGGNRDTAWFSIIDSDWPLVRAAFEAWLSPDNFRADGSQIARLDDIRAALAAKGPA